MAGVLAQVEGALGDRHVDQVVADAKGESQLRIKLLDHVAGGAPDTELVDLGDVGADGGVNVLGGLVIRRLEVRGAGVDVGDADGEGFARGVGVGDGLAVDVEGGLVDEPAPAEVGHRHVEVDIRNLALVVVLVHAAERELARRAALARVEEEGEEGFGDAAVLREGPEPG